MGRPPALSAESRTAIEVITAKASAPSTAAIRMRRRRSLSSSALNVRVIGLLRSPW